MYNTVTWQRDYKIMNYLTIKKLSKKNRSILIKATKMRTLL